MTVHDASAPKPIEPGDIVCYHPEKHRVLFGRVLDIYTGRPYVVGTQPALVFQNPDGTKTAPIPYFRGEDELPYWDYATDVHEKAEKAATAEVKPAQQKRGKKPKL